MNRGILSIKIMLLGAVMFFSGCLIPNYLPTALAFYAGPVVMLAGLLMGNHKEEKKDDKYESH